MPTPRQLPTKVWQKQEEANERCNQWKTSNKHWKIHRRFPWACESTSITISHSVTRRHKPGSLWWHSIIHVSASVDLFEQPRSPHTLSLCLCCLQVSEVLHTKGIRLRDIVSPQSNCHRITMICITTISLWETIKRLVRIVAYIHISIVTAAASRRLYKLALPKIFCPLLKSFH